ncbi:MAG: LamG domain-containing protein [Candidatus Pacebacteria bacterium]|nr:LamG domain-containing protein [Candidatus Paceibacterota bacterium]
MHHESCNKKIPASRNSQPTSRAIHATRCALHGNAGFTLFYAVLTASLLLAIGIAIFNITFKELILSSGARESANAFYAADTGLECALYWDLKHESISSPAFGFYGDSLANSLIGYWRFEDGAGSLLALDSSGQEHIGTLTNMNSATAWVGGTIGDALSFDGTDDHVLVPDLDYTDEISGSLWVWFNAVTNQQMLVSQSNTIEVQMQMEGAAGSSKFRIRVDTASGADVVNSTTMATAGVWYHVAWTYDGTNVKLYINGNEETNFVQNTGSGNIADRNEDYAIGARNNAALPTGGLIDDLRIYNRALSDDEIEALADKESNLMFVQPIAEASNATCLGADITDPATGWDPEEGWEVSTTTTSASTTFDMIFESGRCATVEVVKNSATTTIISRGYNSCDLDDPRRVERAIRAMY